MSPDDDRFAPVPRPAWTARTALSRSDCVSAFDGTEAYTVGVEEELMLLSGETLDLHPGVERALAAVSDGRLRRELRAAQVEIVTPACRGVAEAGRQIAEVRRCLVAALRPTVLVAAAGAHPFSTAWSGISEGERYRTLAAEYRWAAKRSVACGLHVHVAIGEAGRALAVYNALRSYLPELAALSANAPFAEGRDTGLASIRPTLNQAFPREGVPPAFADWADFADLVAWGRAGGAFPDATYLWWDLRPHPAFGTLELRVADAQTTVEDVTGVVAVAQCLVAWLGSRHDAGEELPVHEAVRISENLWSALRFGLSGWLADLAGGPAQPTRDRLGELLDELAPTAESLECGDELAHARALLAGNGADRQRYVAAREGMDGLVRWLVRATDPGGA